MPLSKLEPLSDLELIRLSDCDPTYSCVHRFKDTAEKNSYFSDIYLMRKMGFEQITPIRISTNSVRVNIPSDEALMYNYMRFKNTNYNKTFWYYAFITSVDWVNVNCCDIHFEIDVFTTYWEFTDFGTAFVLRSHYYQTVDEQIGDNLEAEDMKPQHIVEEQLTDTLGNGKLLGDNPYRILVLYTVKGSQPTGTSYGNYVLGCSWRDFNIPQYPLPPTDYLNFISTLDVDDIVSVYIVPELCIPSQPTFEGLSRVIKVTKTDINGYVPKNKKLFTYPYNFLRMYFGNSVNEYRLEYFLNSSETDFNASFEVDGVVGVPPTLICYPTLYKAYTEKTSGGLMTLTNFPQVLHSASAMKTYVDRGGIQSSLLESLTSISSGLLNSTITSNPIPLVSAVANAGTDILQDIIKTTNSPNIVRGNLGDSAGITFGLADFTPVHAYASEIELKSIDDYFSRFGYSDNHLRKVDVENIGKHWCYWKTSSKPCTSKLYNIIGEDKSNLYVPPYALEIMNNAFLRGVTFFDIDTEFNDFSKDNRFERVSETLL